MTRREKPMAIPLFIDAYLAGTMMLTAEQDGCHLRLMMAAFRQPDCSLPYDDAQLATIARLPLAKWRKIKAPIIALWTVEGGRLWQRRLRREWEYVHKKREQARAAVASRGDRNGNESATDVASDVATDVVTTLVEVEGRGLYQEEGSGSKSHTREPFTVIGGGR